jgi:uncharacterized protein
MIGLEIVIALVLLVILLAGVAAIRALRERLGGPTRTPADRRLAEVSWSLLAVGVACFCYGVFIEADWLEVTHVYVKSPKLQPGSTVTIALISDLHVDRDSRALAQLTKAVRAAQPDLLVFAGDSINTRESTELFRRTLTGLPARLGRVAVRGNHDVYRWGDVDLFGDNVATELSGEGPVLLEHLAICGAPFDQPFTVAPCLAKAPPEALSVVVYHSPDLIEDLEPRPDLYLAGHTHGGQVRLPFFGAVITFSRFGKKYEMGRYDVRATTLYVNRGIGFEPVAPRVRFLARPELTILHVLAQ